VSKPLKLGEKIILGFGFFLLMVAIVGFIGMEIYRAHLNHAMYTNVTHFDFSEQGQEGSELFRKEGCTSCHRAVRNGSNNGLSLDGIGSKRTLEQINAFLANPEKNYGASTVDHGSQPKAAAYVAELPDTTRHSIAVFLSELKAVQGSADARVPAAERSEFIDSMVKLWAPDSWKKEYTDVRDSNKE
jgi:cytochrome c553